MSIEFIDAEIKKECLFFQMESREDFSSLLSEYDLEQLVTAGTLLTPYLMQLENVTFVLKTLTTFTIVFIVSLLFVLYISNYVDIFVNRKRYAAKEILGFAAHALDYNLVSTKGFPYNVTTSEDVKDHEGVSFVVPIGLEENVIQLHQDLFNDETYEPSEKVKKISEDIIYMTDVTPDNTKAMKSTFEGDIQDEGSE